MRYEFTCQHCGTDASVYRSPSSKGGIPKFCSQQCNGASREGTGNGPTPNYFYECESCGTPCQAYRSPSASTPRFCSVTCTGQSQIGSSNPSFTGGRHKADTGYIRVLAPDHHESDSRGYVFEHRLIAEQTIGRRLRSGEVVHHLNQIKHDNRPENLQVMPSQAAHLALHRELKRVSA
jgi:hypothetical protein